MLYMYMLYITSTFDMYLDTSTKYIFVIIDM